MSMKIGKQHSENFDNKLMGFFLDSINDCVIELILVPVDMDYIWYEPKRLITLVNNGTCVKGTVECRILYCVCERGERED